MALRRKNENYDRGVHLRFTEEDYKALVSVAEKKRITVSSVIREAAVEKYIENKAPKKTRAIDNNDILSTIKSLKSSYGRVAHAFEMMSTLRRSDGEPAVNESTFTRYCQEVIQVHEKTIECLEGATGKRKVQKPKAKELKAAVPNMTGRGLYVTISGTVSSRPKYYEDNIIFMVSTNVSVKEKKYTYTIEVIIPKTHAPKNLKPGSPFTVSGDLVVEFDTAHLFNQIKLTLFADCE